MSAWGPHFPYTSPSSGVLSYKRKRGAARADSYYLYPSCCTSGWFEATEESMQLDSRCWIRSSDHSRRLQLYKKQMRRRKRKRTRKAIVTHAWNKRSMIMVFMKLGENEYFFFLIIRLYTTVSNNAYIPCQVKNPLSNHYSKDFVPEKRRLPTVART